MNKIEKKKKKSFEVDTSLLDPKINDQRVSELLYEGNPEKLYILAENPRFNNLNKDVFKAISKEKQIINFKHPWFKTFLYLSILFLLGVVQIFPFWVTSLWFIFCVLYYIFGFQSFNLAMKIRENERINNLNELVINSDFEDPEKKRIRERREHLEAINSVQNEEQKNDQKK